jgi:hypothetical protein
MGTSGSKNLPCLPLPANKAVTSLRAYSDRLFVCIKENQLLQLSTRQRKAIKHHGAVIPYTLCVLRTTPEKNILFISDEHGY